MYGNEAQNTSHAPTPYTQASCDASQQAPRPQATQDAQEACQAARGTQAFAPSQAHEASQKATRLASQGHASTSYLASTWSAQDKGASRGRAASRQEWLLLGGA